MIQRTAYEPIVTDESGVALIEGTTMKVIKLVLEITAYGWSAEDLQFQQLSPLTRADPFWTSLLLGPR